MYRFLIACLALLFTVPVVAAQSPDHPRPSDARTITVSGVGSVEA